VLVDSAAVLTVLGYDTLSAAEGPDALPSAWPVRPERLRGESSALLADSELELAPDSRSAGTAARAGELDRTRMARADRATRHELIAPAGQRDRDNRRRLQGRPGKGAIGQDRAAGFIPQATVSGW
jgi:hypothetical protein